ncbi:MAG TPA: nucleotidyltransferase family protein [Pirellulaceae bacterium]|nr:nucleotidyltransferase family protein [Pirellulaceae bacterium]
MSNVVTMPWEILDRMERAVAKVRDRLLRATAALNQAGVPYAVVGGHAVASWVATVDEGAVRNTRDVDLLVRREDLTAVTTALQKAGFTPEQSFGVTMFLDGPDAKPSESIHLLFEGEKVKENDPFDAPTITTTDDPAGFHVLTFESLVRMKLLANRDKDKTHIRDMIGVGLIDQTWLAKLPPVLAERLKAILDTPEG